MESIFNKWSERLSEFLYTEEGLSNIKDQMRFEEITIRQQKIVQCLRSGPKAFDEIQSYLDGQSSILDKDLRLSLRTFQRDIRNIEAIYHIIIAYNSSTAKYEIQEDLNPKRPIQAMLGHLDILMILSASKMLPDHILLQEKNETSTKHLFLALEAIRSRKEIEFIHRKYHLERPQKRRLRPYGVKEHDQRWYLFGQDIDKDGFRIFGLDRVTEMKILNATFGPQPENVGHYFQHAYGAEPSFDETPDPIEITLTNFQAAYLKTAPLHPSQKLIKETDTGTTFGFLLVPKHNFIMKMISFGGHLLEVEPPSLRGRILEQLNELTRNLKS